MNQIPETLIRLNRELTNGHRRAFVTANDGQTRILVQREHEQVRHWPGERDFRASAVVGGREIVEHGILPSQAVTRLLPRLRSVTGREGDEAATTDNDLSSIDRF